MVRGAKQNGLLFQLHPFLAMPKDLADDELSLLVFVNTADNLRPLPFRPGRPQFFVMSLRRLDDDPVGGFQHRLRASIIFFEHDNFRARKLLRKVQDVSYRRRSE